MTWWVVVCVALSACGRVGFGHLPDDDASQGVDDGGKTDGVVVDGSVADVIVPSLCPNATLVGPGRTPALAWSGTNFGIAYLSANAVRFSTVTSGVPSPSTLIRDAVSFAGRPALAWRFPSSWIAGVSGGGVYLQEIATNGTPVGGPVMADVNGGSPTFATGGGPLRFAWTGLYMSNFEVFTSEVASDMSLVNPVRVTSSAYGSSNPSVAWTGSEWNVIWDASLLRMSCVEHSLETRRITAGGALASGQDVRAFLFNCGTIGNPENHRPKLTWNGTDFTVVWDPAPQPGAIQTARFSTTITTPKQLTSSDVSHSSSSAWTGSELGVAWSAGGVFITRIDPSGTVLGEITLDDAGAAPSIAWDGTRYAAAYERDGNIYFVATCP